MKEFAHHAIGMHIADRTLRMSAETADRCSSPSVAVRTAPAEPRRAFPSSRP